jgi:hypothetical protein
MVRVPGPGPPAADWVSVNVLSPIRISADRAAPVFAAAENGTVPLPWPDAPAAATVIHEAFVDAVQAQDDVVETFTLPLYCDAPIDNEVGVRVYEQAALPVIVRGIASGSRLPPMMN